MKAFLGRQRIVLQCGRSQTQNCFGAVEHRVDLAPRLDQRLSHLPRDIERHGFLDGSKGIHESAADFDSLADRNLAPLLLRGPHLPEDGREFGFGRGLDGAIEFFGRRVYQVDQGGFGHAFQLSSYSAKRSACVQGRMFVLWQESSKALTDRLSRLSRGTP